MKLKIKHRLLIGGIAFVTAFAVLLCCTVFTVESRVLYGILVTLSLALLVFATGWFYLTAQTLNRLLGCVREVVAAIAAGRLTAAEEVLAVHGKQDELARRQTDDEAAALLTAFSTMVENVSSPLKQLRASGEGVGQSSLHLAASVKQLESAVIGQVASTNEVSVASKEIFATVQELAGTMHAVKQMASQATGLATAGMDSLGGINSTMSELSEATAGMSSVLNAISERAAAITKVMTTITGVANRTNLISLNAAIEAEKAGDQAAGFSVVAVEIRRLADQASVAALDIEKMIGEMQAAVKDGVARMSLYASRAQSSSATVIGITSDLGHAIDYTRQLEPHFEAVNNGMQMQSRAAGQILEAMQQLAANAGETRDSLAQVRHAADQMQAAAHQLQSELGRLAVDT